MKGNYTYLTEKFEGATVIEPRRGYFLDPVATLDFASLYPSIMMAHNLCYTTLVDPKDVHKYAKRKIKINKTPNGDYFVDSSVCKGVLPIILEEIVSKRKVVKEQMKVCEDPFDREILDARQQAMKVVANSVYGFTGAHVGMLQSLSSQMSGIAHRNDAVPPHFVLCDLLRAPHDRADQESRPEEVLQDSWVPL